MAESSEAGSLDTHVPSPQQMHTQAYVDPSSWEGVSTLVPGVGGQLSRRSLQDTCSEEGGRPRDTHSPTKKDCAGRVPSSSGASEAQLLHKPLLHVRSLGSVELMRSRAWMSGEHPPILGIPKEEVVRGGGECSDIRVLRVLTSGAEPLS